MWQHKWALLILFRTRTWSSTYTDVTSCLEHKNRNTHVNVTECYRDRNRSKLICRHVTSSSPKDQGVEPAFPTCKYLWHHDKRIRCRTTAKHQVLKDAKKTFLFVLLHFCHEPSGQTVVTTAITGFKQTGTCFLQTSSEKLIDQTRNSPAPEVMSQLPINVSGSITRVTAIISISWLLAPSPAFIMKVTGLYHEIHHLSNIFNFFKYIFIVNTIR